MPLSQRKTPPGPHSFSLLGQAIPIQQETLRFTSQIWQQYGDIVRLRILQKPATVFFHPDFAQWILQTHHVNYDKSEKVPIFRAVQTLLGEGLFSTNGPVWRSQRRLIQPVFHRKMISSFAPVVIQATLHMLTRWQEQEKGKVLDITEEMAKLVLHIIAGAFFSFNSSEQAAQIRHILEHMWQSFQYYVNLPFPPLFVPSPRNRRIQQGIHELDQLVYTLIQQRRRQPPPERSDLLSLLLATRDEEGKGMSDKQIRDQVITLLVGGHESTAATLSWIFYVLGEYPLVEQRLHRELDEILGGKLPTVEQVSQLTYTQMVMHETLRLYPATFAIVRRVIADDEIGGYHIPKGSIAFVAPYYMHRHPDFWEDPERFDPERFGQQAGSRRHKFAYLPFGAGPRSCIGSGFAQMEIPLILACIAQRYQLRLVPGHPVEPFTALTMRPRYGLHMTFSAR